MAKSNSSPQTWTINTIQDAVRNAGSHWFDPDSMRYFGTRILPIVYQGLGGVYFVTSEQPPHGERQHSVRQFDPDLKHISTLGQLASMTRTEAIARAKQAAGAGHKATGQDFAAVTPAEQFLHDLHAAGYKKATPQWVATMIGLHAEHHAACELECSIPNAPSPDPIRAKIAKHAKKIGVGVLLSSDPRGCVTKIVAQGLEANDSGREGYCVPSNANDEVR